MSLKEFFPDTLKMYFTVIILLTSYNLLTLSKIVFLLKRMGPDRFWMIFRIVLQIYLHQVFGTICNKHFLIAEFTPCTLFFVILSLCLRKGSGNYDGSGWDDDDMMKLSGSMEELR